MDRIRKPLAIITIMLAVVFGGCPNDRETGQSHDTDMPREARGEHDRDGGEESGHDRDGEGHHGEEGEESGVELGFNDTYDKVRNGARLILTYNAQSNTFSGTVENTTDKTLQQIRVEVHLSNGKEIGPTTPDDLAPGQKREVKLTAASTDFNGWTAHPEVGTGEHGSEERGEHDREGSGEHR